MSNLLLFLLEQDEQTGYDTFDSIVVAATDAGDAAEIHPYSRLFPKPNREENWESEAWASSPKNVKVTLIGTAKHDTQRGVICASFNAG
jgi:hypothetical protein